MTALNFDPYAALAEIENRSRLRANGAKRANPGQTLAQLAQLALSPAQVRKTVSPESAPECPDQWRAHLARLDAQAAPGGIAPARWRELVVDARWIADRHGDSAAALGWTASDLFGMDDRRDGWGGVADRLDGARRLAFTTTVAHWRGDECEGWLWRQSLSAKPLLWEGLA